MYKSKNWSKINYLWSFRRNKLFAGHVKKYATGYLVSEDIFSYLHPQKNKKNILLAVLWDRISFSIFWRWKYLLKINDLYKSREQKIEVLQTSCRKTLMKEFGSSFYCGMNRPSEAARICPWKPHKLDLGTVGSNFFHFWTKQICSFNLCLYFGKSWSQLLK